MEAELNAWMQSWWAGHPEATLTELETELDQQVAALRAQVLQATLAQGEEQVAARSAATAVCPVCGAKLAKSGRHKRTLKTRGGQVLDLERTYLSCPRCGKGFFPPGP